jgi:hypothetical protein
MDMHELTYKDIMSIIRVNILTLSILLLGCTTVSKEVPEHPISTKQIVGSIQVTLLEVNKLLGEKNAPRIKQGKLILNTTMTRSQQGSMSLSPISGKEGSSQSATGTITIKLKPVPEKRSVDKLSEYRVNLEFAEAIVSSVQEIAQVEQGPVPMKFEEVIAKISFSVSANASGGVSLKVASVSLGSEKSHSQSNNHTLELVFVPR